MTKRTFILQPRPHPARRNAAEAVMQAPDGYTVTVSEPSRSLEQNAAQWPVLAAFAAQKQAVINGKLEWISDDEWKDILTAAFRDELNRVALFRGRMVLMGQRTSKFGKGEFSGWLDWLHAAAIEEGVVVYPEEVPA